MTVDLVTFGCRLNGVESDVMRRRAAQAGLAEAVIVNTCAVTAEAVRQGAQAVRRAARDRPGAPIYVTGCAAEREPARFAGLPGVAALVGNAAKTQAATWSEVAGGRPAPAPGGAAEASRIAAEGGEVRVRAFLAVQTGCDHRCTFCAIPSGRGRSRSAPAGDVVAAARALVERGAGEIVLTGVDITAYGLDLGGEVRLGGLVRRLLRELPELARLRLSSIDQVEADPGLVAAFAEEERLMPHLHLSLQAGDDLILKRMRRRHARADALAFCAELRRLRPGIVFGADLIAGFPTESEAMFAGSLGLVEECGLTWLHVFPYSAREGTPAARMPAVAREIVRERAARLREAGDRAVRRHLAGEVGGRRRVLAETPGTGRTEAFAPVRLGAPVARGSLIEVAISGENGRELLAA